MEERIKELNQQLNDIIVNNGCDENAIICNLQLFYEIGCTYENEFKNFYNNNQFLIHIDDIPKCSVLDTIKILKFFYRTHNVDFDLDKIISNGTLNFNENELIEFNTLNCHNYYENGHKLIDTNNTGLITDSLVALHEISHYRDQPDRRRNQVSDLLTESLAIVEELILADDLSQIGYEKIKEFWFKRLYVTHYEMCTYYNPIIKLLLLYKNLSNISRDSYKFYFNDDSDYEEIIEKTEYVLEDEKFYLESYPWYILGVHLASFMYLEYKKDNNYLNKITLLHDKINTSDIFECLEIIGLTDLGIEDRQKLLSSVKEIINSIENENVKKISKFYK